MTLMTNKKNKEFRIFLKAQQILFGCITTLDRLLFPVTFLWVYALEKKKLENLKYGAQTALQYGVLQRKVKHQVRP